MYSTTLDTSSEESSSSSSQGMTSSSTENTDSADSEETTTTQEISDHKSSGTTVGALPTTPNQINTQTGNLYLITAPTNFVNYRYYISQLGFMKIVMFNFVGSIVELPSPYRQKDTCLVECQGYCMKFFSRFTCSLGN